MSFVKRFGPFSRLSPFEPVGWQINSNGPNGLNPAAIGGTKPFFTSST
jgi:hypothetical protein